MIPSPITRRVTAVLLLCGGLLTSIPSVMAAEPVPRAFLSIPFAESARKDLTITEGWKYSDAERAIHGVKTHYAVDFAAPRGTPIYAPSAGFALSSVHINYGGDYQGKRIGYALGRFVQIWHPGAKVYTQYGHLEGTGPGIPYVAPQRSKTASGSVLYDPTIVYRPVADFLKKAKFVRKGQLIGYVGDSGLSWGYDEGLKRPDPAKYPSWDETHLHFEVFDRDAKGKKDHRYDPFGLYAQADAYQSWTPAPSGLWLKNKEGGLRWVRK